MSEIKRDEVTFPTRPAPSPEEMDGFMDAETVTKCVCSGFCLKELIAIARERNLGAEDVMTLTGAGQDSGCGVCQPYIHRAIKTGEEEVPIDVSDTKMWVPKEGILDKEPPKNVPPSPPEDTLTEVRQSAAESRDSSEGAGIKTEVE